MAEQIRKKPVTPTRENHEAERMLSEAEQRQRAEAARTAGKAITAELDAVLDDIEEVLEKEGLHTEKGAQDMINNYTQRGGE